MFGGYAALGRLLGVPRSLANDWQRKPRAKPDTMGDVPPRHARRLLEIARERGADLSEHDLLFGRDLPDALPLGAIG